MADPNEHDAKQPRRVKILDVAAEAINRHGLTSTSLSQVAKAAGVSRAALYYYFKDQQDLVSQCYVRSLELMSGCLDEAEAENDGSIDTIFCFIDNLLSSDTPEIAALSDVAYLTPEWQTNVKKMFVLLRDRIATIISKGIESGELRPCIPNVSAAAIIGMVEWLPMASRWPTLGPVSKDKLISALKTLVRFGVAGDRKAPPSYPTLTPSPLMIPAVNIFDTDVLSSARREAILARASWLFNRKGIDSTFFDEIADTLGVSRKVIYHYVGGKSVLVEECYRRSFRLYEKIAQSLETLDGPKINIIVATAYANAEATLRRDIAPLEPLTGFDTLPEKVKDEVTATTSRLIKNYIGIYEEGQADGSIRQLEPLPILAMRPGNHEWLRTWIDTLSEEEISKAPREIAEITRIGLQAI